MAKAETQQWLLETLMDECAMTCHEATFVAEEAVGAAGAVLRRIAEIKASQAK